MDAEVEEGEETKVEKEEVRVQSARPVVAAGVVDPAAACLQQASTGRIRLTSISYGTEGYCERKKHRRYRMYLFLGSQ